MHKYQLTLNSLWKYVNEIFGDVEVAYPPPHGNNVRSTYAKEYERTLSGLPLTGTGKIDKKVLKEQFKGVLK